MYTEFKHLDALASLVGRQRKLETEIEAGMVTDRRMEGLRRCKEQMRLLEVTLRDLEEWNVDFAKVLASSGYRLADTGCNLDWALLEIQTERIGQNSVRLTIEFLRDCYYSTNSSSRCQLILHTGCGRRGWRRPGMSRPMSRWLNSPAMATLSVVASPMCDPT